MNAQASIPIPFAIGEQLWRAAADPAQQWETCPCCFGKLKIMMVLGNGEELTINCEMCAQGWREPSGKVRTHQVRYSPRSFTPQRVSMSGNDIHYSEASPDATCYNYADASKLTRDRSECQAQCDLLNAEHAAEEEGRLVHQLIQKKKSMAWSVGYWRNQLKKCEQEAERLRERLGIVVASKKAKP